MNLSLIFFGVLMMIFLMGVITAIVKGSGLDTRNEKIGLIARLTSVIIASITVGAISTKDALLNGISVGAIGYVPFLITTCVVRPRPRGASLPLVILAWVIWLPLYMLFGAIGAFIGNFLGSKF